MKRRPTTLLALTLALPAIGGAAAEPAPEPRPTRVERRLDVVRHVRPGPGAGDHVTHVSLLGDGLGARKKDAPFTATAITEIDQPLADGNRIRQRSASAVARDRAGRTRREVALGAVGPLLAAGEAPRLVHLHDPVAGTDVTLDPARKIAFKAPRAEPRVAPPPGEKGDAVTEEDRRIVVGGPHAPLPIGLPPPSATPLVIPLVDGVPPGGAAPAREELGTQVIEGLKAQGTRTTITIPPGKVGNERPIAIVTERWVSPELGLVVLSKHSDPRLGTTTYRLTAIERREPSAATFEIPAGFTIEEAPATSLHRRRLPVGR
jgi:hypothetical protein